MHNNFFSQICNKNNLENRKYHVRSFFTIPTHTDSYGVEISLTSLNPTNPTFAGGFLEKIMKSGQTLNSVETHSFCTSTHSCRNCNLTIPCRSSFVEITTKTQFFSFFPFLTKIRRTLKQVATKMFSQALFCIKTATILYFSLHHIIQELGHTNTYYANKHLLQPLIILILSLHTITSIRNTLKRRLQAVFNKFRKLSILYPLISRLYNFRQPNYATTAVWQQINLVYFTQKVNDYRLLALNCIIHVS